jgi:integrase/recombinase XerD
MNRRPLGLLLKKAINGFLQFKTAEGLSPSTLEHYRHILDLWMERQPDVDITWVTSKDIRDHLTYMRLEYTPRRITGGNDRKLFSKSIRNIYVTFSAFFRWAKDEFDIPSPMGNVPAPKTTSPEIIPLSKEEIERLIKVCDSCDEAKTDLRRKFTMRRPTARRDRAIVLTLLDTGLRATELCSLLIGNVDLNTGKVSVMHGVRGGAKGSKGRTVFLGKTARRAVWRYLADRDDRDDPEAPLFIGKTNCAFNKDALRQVINALGNKAGVKKCYPHRFRHTFSITYLRSGGDVFTLQMLLGHSSLDMVKRYARVAEIDAERVHHKASPADNWRL